MIKLIIIAACLIGSGRMSNAQLDSATPLKAQPAQAEVGGEEHPARVSGGMMAGTVLTKAVPRVPRAALVDKPPGTMVIAVVINPQGKVSKAAVVSGAPVLRPYYLDAVRQWTYKPFYLNGQPVYVQSTVTISVSFGALD